MAHWLQAPDIVVTHHRMGDVLDPKMVKKQTGKAWFDQKHITPSYAIASTRCLIKMAVAAGQHNPRVVLLAEAVPSHPEVKEIIKALAPVKVTLLNEAALDTPHAFQLMTNSYYLSVESHNAFGRVAAVFTQGTVLAADMGTGVSDKEFNGNDGNPLFHSVSNVLPNGTTTDWETAFCQLKMCQCHD